MKKLTIMKWATAAFLLCGVTACNSDDPKPGDVEAAVSYIINFGNYTGDKSSITAFDKETNTASNNYYFGVNGVSMVSNVQHALNYNGNIYFLGNNTDELFWVDAETFEQTSNAILTDIVKPRYGVGSGNYLYVSCWGGDIWTDETLSYVAKVNLNSNEVEKKISVPGGPEGMAVVDNKLYMALNYKDSVAVMDLTSEEISYIEMPAVSSYFLKDKKNNLYVSLVSTYSDFSETTGLAYINTAGDELEEVFVQEGVSTSYVNIIEPNDDFSKIYVMTSSYDDNWNLVGGISVFDVATKSFGTEKLADNVGGLNGLEFYNNRLFVFIAETVTGNGEAQIYLPDGTMETSFETGIAPFMMVTAD